MKITRDIKWIHRFVARYDSRRSNLKIAESSLKLSGKGIVIGWDSGKTERHRRGKPHIGGDALR